MNEPSTREQIYPHYRLSMESTSTQASYAFMEKLRNVREDGFRDIQAVEHYDPDFSIPRRMCDGRGCGASVDAVAGASRQRPAQHVGGTQADLAAQDEARRDTVSLNLRHPWS